MRQQVTRDRQQSTKAAFSQLFTMKWTFLAAITILPWTLNAQDVILTGTPRAAALQSAINQAQGMGCVIIAANTNVILDAPVVINYSRACLRGAGPTSTLTNTSSSPWPIQVTGAEGASTTLASDAREDSPLILSLNGNIGAGTLDWISLHWPATLQAFDNLFQVVQVVNAVGTTITPGEPLHETFPASGTVVTKLIPVDGVEIGNFALSNGGISITIATNANVHDIQITNSPYSGLLALCGHGNHFSNITTLGGSHRELSAISLLGQTSFIAENLSSYNSLGYGISLHWSNGGRVTNLLAAHASGYAIATDHVAWSTFTNLVATNAVLGSPGIAIRLQSHRNTFTNCVAQSNDAPGIFFYESYSNYVTNSVSRFNTNSDVDFIDSTGNTIRNSEFGIVTNDAGNVIAP